MKKGTETTNANPNHLRLLNLAGDLTYADVCNAIGAEAASAFVEAFGRCKSGKENAFAELEKRYTEYATTQTEVIRST